MATSRRKFIKISALGLGGVTISASGLDLLASNSYLEELSIDNFAKTFNRIPTYCEVCFWKCAVCAPGEQVVWACTQIMTD